MQNIGAFHCRKNLNPILLRRAAEEPNLTHATGHHRVLNGQRKIPLELVLLRHITNMRTRHTRRLTQHPNLTGRRANQTQNGAQQRGLTGTISTNQTRKLAALQGQGQILEDGTARVAGVQV